MRGPLRLRDENMPPASNVGVLKTIHQRNKSTPALSALLKPAMTNQIQPKRSAFADLSNTVRSFVAAKDDMALFKKSAYENIPLKDAYNPVKEAVKPVQATVPGALLRPAQRSLSIMGMKTNQAFAATTATIAKPVVGDVRESSLGVAVVEPAAESIITRKPLAKRQTAIFREPELPQPVLAPIVELTAITSLQPNTVTVAAPPFAAPDTQKALPEPPLSEEQAIDGVSLLPALPPQDPIEFLQLTSNFQENFQESFPSFSEVDPTSIYPEIQLHNPLPATTEPIISLNEEKEVYLPALESQFKALDPALDEKIIPISVPDIDGYWEEEDDEEYFDAEGYTARSIRSRGDNTTGAMTTVLAPRVTAAIDRELAAAKIFVEQNRTDEDIEDEMFDTSMVAEYGDDIFDYMRDLEERMRPNPYYMESQAEIQWSMRSVLMDWLTQVHCRFQLLPETLFLAVNYVDRFLSCKVVSLGKLQLVGATAIFVAAKYEEINCPSVQEIVYMVDGGYTVEEILKAERFMLSMLKFELGWPGPMSFLRRISKADDYDLETRTLAKYFLEVTIMDERFVGCVPSFTAAGSHCLARMMLRKGDWVR